MDAPPPGPCSPRLISLVAQEVTPLEAGSPQAWPLPTWRVGNLHSGLCAPRHELQTLIPGPKDLGVTMTSSDSSFRSDLILPLPGEERGWDNPEGEAKPCPHISLGAEKGHPPYGPIHVPPSPPPSLDLFYPSRIVKQMVWLFIARISQNPTARPCKASMGRCAARL